MQRMEINAAIESCVKHANPQEYRLWTIGITNNPERRKEEHGAKENIKFWKTWAADSEADARAIEQYFLDKGMKGGSGGGESPNHVYIF